MIYCLMHVNNFYLFQIRNLTRNNPKRIVRMKGVQRAYITRGRLEKKKNRMFSVLLLAYIVSGNNECRFGTTGPRD